MRTPTRGFDAAVDALTSFAAITTFAVSAGIEAFAASARRADATIIDVTATADSATSALPANAKHHAKLTRRGKKEKELLSPRLTRRGQKEKELLLSGPHSPLWRGSASISYDEEGWGI